MDNVKEASLVKGMNIFAFNKLNEVTDFLIGTNPYEPIEIKDSHHIENPYILDFEDVQSQDSSIEFVAIAAAGGHNLLMSGSPGCGKSMIAKRIPTILPSMSEEEALEVTKIYSVAGLLKNRGSLISQRPFRSPHHNASMNSLVGGGLFAMPGEISLAHNGILFLDEILEFKRDVLEVLREPLEEKVININRINGTYKLPSNFLLVGAFNPCPCGLFLNGIDENRCTCSESDRKRYLNRLSRALLDRIDLLNYVPRLKYEDISKRKDSLSSEKMKERVLKAREIQRDRYKKSEYNYNSEVKGRDIENLFNLSEESKKVLKIHYEKLNLTMRGYDKIIKVSRTIADLEGSEKIQDYHIFEALGYRKNVDGEIV